MLPQVALVGRPNVGKSTLFNALTRSRDALVADQPGLTRDRQYGVCRRDRHPFVVIDTGGMAGEKEGLAGLTSQQAQAAIGEADVVVFVVDAREGVMPLDRDILALLRRSGRPLVLAVNKSDVGDATQSAAEFAALGVQPLVQTVASHQRGIDELLDALRPLLPAEQGADDEAEDPGRIRLAFIGRPNVGKSTLVNRLLGEERVIASEVPGTTRDAIAIDMERDGRRYRLVDTAGIRRKGRVEQGIEKLSVLKSLQAIESVDVVVVLLDAAEGVTDQDAHVLGHAIDAGRALVVAVNKWDGLDASHREQCKHAIERKLVFAPWAERVTISALHGSGLRQLFAAVHRAYDSATRKFGTAEVTRALEAAVQSHPPPVVRGRAAKLRFAHPGGDRPPTFVIHGNRAATLPANYRRYLENFLRTRFRLVGTPLRLEFREGENPFEGKRNELTDRQKRRRRRLIRHVRR